MGMRKKTETALLAFSQIKILKLSLFITVEINCSLTWNQKIHKKIKDNNKRFYANDISLFLSNQNLV